MRRSSDSENGESHGSGGYHQGSVGLVTFGGSGGTSKGRKGLKSEYEIDEVGQGDWTRIEDTGSDKESTVPIRGIRKDTTYEVETASMPGNGRGHGHH